jgi:Uma2 family endonuclease
MALAEFLAWEDRQERKWEFDGAAPVAMVGVTRAHAIIQTNLTAALAARLRGTPCRFYGPELKVHVADSIRYPDGFVACTPGAMGDRVVEDPVVLFEILSDSTAETDRTVKAREYRATPSVRRYAMLEQTRIAATMHVRDDGGCGDRWLAVLLFEQDILSMPEIGVELPLAELYEGVDLPQPGDDRRDDEGDPPPAAPA